MYMALIPACRVNPGRDQCHTHGLTHIYIYIHIFIYKYIYIYIYIYMCVCVYSGWNTIFLGSTLTLTLTL